MDEQGNRYITAADAGELHIDDDIVWVFDVWYRSFLEFDFLRRFEYEGKVLCKTRQFPPFEVRIVDGGAAG